MIDVITPFTPPFGMLTFSVNMTNAPIAILFMWLKDLSLNHGSIFATFVSIFNLYIFM